MYLSAAEIQPYMNCILIEEQKKIYKEPAIIYGILKNHISNFEVHVAWNISHSKNTLNLKGFSK